MCIVKSSEKLWEMESLVTSEQRRQQSVNMGAVQLWLRRGRSACSRPMTPCWWGSWQGPQPPFKSGTVWDTLPPTEGETLDGTNLVLPSWRNVWHWLTLADWCKLCIQMGGMEWGKLTRLWGLIRCALLYFSLGYSSEMPFKCIVFILPINFSLICVASHTSIRWVPTCHNSDLPLPLFSIH